MHAVCKCIGLVTKTVQRSKAYCYKSGHDTITIMIEIQKTNDYKSRWKTYICVELQMLKTPCKEATDI